MWNILKNVIILSSELLECVAMKKIKALLVTNYSVGNLRIDKAPFSTKRAKFNRALGMLKMLLHFSSFKILIGAGIFERSHEILDTSPAQGTSKSIIIIYQRL